jgi:hypothetical protein
MLALAFVLIAQVAPSPPPPPAASPYPTKPVVIDMGEDVIEGSVHGRNDHVQACRITVKFKSLIQIRTDFKAELLATAP